MDLTKNTEIWFSIDFILERNITEFIADILWPSIQSFQERELIGLFFFTREWEKEHLIKFMIKPFDSSIEMNGLINEITNTLVFKNYVSVNPCALNFSEINMDQTQIRYGETIGFNWLLEIYHKSSSSTCMIFADINLKWSYPLSISFAIQKHLIFLRNSYMSLDETISFLNFQLDNSIQLSFKKRTEDIDNNNQKSVMISHFQQSYMKQHALIKRLINMFYTNNCKYDKNWMIEWENGVSEKLCKFLNFHKDHSSSVLIQSLYRNQKDNSLTSHKLLPKWIILNDLIHLENNRLGINYRDEPFICYLILKGIKELKDTE